MTTTTTPAQTPVAARAAQRTGLDRAFDLISRYGTIASLVICFAFFSAVKPDIFPTTTNLLNMLNAVAFLGIVALGLTVALVQGLFDLSVPAMATIAGFLVTKWLSAGTISNTLLAVLFVLVLAVLVGAFNGAVVAYGNVSAFIVTLAAGSVLTGIVLGASNSQTILMGIPQSFLNIGQGKIGPVQMPAFFLVAIALVLYVVLEHTQVGRHMYAIGGNAETARLAGVPVKRYALIALAISAVCSAFVGILVAANLGVGRPQGVGDTYLLDGFAAAFIGAATLRPGRFHILGTFVGVLLMGVIDNGLNCMNVQPYWQYIVRGTILLIAVFGTSFIVGRRR